MRLMSALFWQELISFFLFWMTNRSHQRSFSFSFSFIKHLSTTYMKKKPAARAESAEFEGLSLLDLPELALENILQRLSPSALCSMSRVCTSLKEKCRSDYFWERHMTEKWGGLIEQSAQRDWQLFIASRRNLTPASHPTSTRWLQCLCSLWPLSCIRSHITQRLDRDHLSSLPSHSIMCLYLFLENGKFWFPAQVSNREHGHVGFMMSCYDAELSYDHHTDTFDARYPPHGRRTTVIEQKVEWERVRAPPTDTPAHVLHISDCVNDLHPGDHVEIQWRRNKEFPYGWWYGVVGHLESCDGNQQFCRCHQSDIVMLEFNQYAPGSRWRRTAINRRDHREVGNEADGFYGGVRKLCNMVEIVRWKKLWPHEALE